MRNLKMAVLSFSLLLAFSLSAAAQTKSLYDRLGGKEAITAVVDEFAGRALADARINQKFGKSDPVRLKMELVDQICFASGGPCQYTGRDMKSTHANMGVTAGEFNALVEDLVGALDKFNVPAAEKNELLGLLGPMKSDIVEVNSPKTGTPLPKKFTPYNANMSSKGSKKMMKKEEKDMKKSDKKSKKSE
ncbi:MAG: group 1 truncated hemoglobin [Acidobacteria bacterium]|nr:group 1 truncated hemoglobin [Acidobacteriota bacterium]